jgi:hypothetical protein
MLIALWGLASEAPLDEVRQSLQQRDAPLLLLDQYAVLETAMHLTVDHGVGGWLRTPERLFDLEAITAVYLRPYASTAVPAIRAAGSGGAAWRHARDLDALLYAWLEVTPALVVNQLGANATNGSKPYQLACIQRAGFSVPPTLVTTDPQAALAFWEEHGEVIYKSVSSIRSIVSRLRPEHRERLADVAWCPTQFQRYIAGRDHRVHVVGDEVFACEVISEADDYRCPGDRPVTVRCCTLPPAVADRCRHLAQSLQLSVAGIDLRRSNEGEWYCLEVNPSPAFSYYQAQAGLPISDAIARFLMSART